MRPQRGPLSGVAVGGFCSIGFAAAAWGHHPTSRPDAVGGGPWPLLWFLGACVFVLAFVATWAVFSFFERRQQSGSGERESSRRS